MTSVLFLCDDNTAVSVMAESILRSIGPRFASYSAGIRPAAMVDAGVLEFLRERRMPTSGMRAKGIREFLLDGAPRLDFVITLSDLAEEEAPDRWSSDPVLAQWNVAESREPLNADTVRDAFWALQRRIKIFASLPLASAPRHAIQHRVEAIATWQ
jgi:protein-tyrosine-phosphatase